MSRFHTNGTGKQRKHPDKPTAAVKHLDDYEKRRAEAKPEDKFLAPMAVTGKAIGWKNLKPQQPYVATYDQREAVAQLRAAGWEIKDISAAMRIPIATMERHFKDELRDGAAFVKGLVTRNITMAAMSGDRHMMLFFAKAKMGWHDVRPWGVVDEKGNTVAPQSLFTVNILGLNSAPQPVSAAPTIDAVPEK